MEKATYILQKDLPDYKAGERFTWHGKSNCYAAENSDVTGQVGKWPARFVENNPEWFKKEEPKQEWEILSLQMHNDIVIHKSSYTYPECFQTLVNAHEFKIHSVRRTSDNEVLSVNSKDFSYGKPCTIISFRVMENGCMWCCVEFETGNKYYNLNILALDKISEEPLPIKDGYAVDIDKGTSEEFKILMLLLEKFKPYQLRNSKMHTSDELLEAQQKAFNAARDTGVNWESDMIRLAVKYQQVKHQTFTDYIHSLNK